MDCKGSCILAARIFSFQLFIYFFAQTDNLKAKTGCLLSDCFKKIHLTPPWRSEMADTWLRLWMQRNAEDQVGFL